MNTIQGLQRPTSFPQVLSPNRIFSNQLAFLQSSYLLGDNTSLATNTATYSHFFAFEASMIILYFYFYYFWLFQYTKFLKIIFIFHFIYFGYITQAGLTVTYWNFEFAFYFLDVVSCLFICLLFYLLAYCLFIYCLFICLLFTYLLTVCLFTVLLDIQTRTELLLGLHYISSYISKPS